MFDFLIILKSVRYIVSQAPSPVSCRVVLDLLEEKANEISQRIVELQRMEMELRNLRRLGETFPTDDIDGKNCVCHLVREQARPHAA